MNGHPEDADVVAPEAAAAMESLERLLGEHWGHVLWIDACRRAGVSSRSAISCDDLRRVASELAEVPGPAGVVGRALGSKVTVYERLRRASAA